MEAATEARLRDSFARQGMMTTLGATIVDVAPGAVTIELPFDTRLTQQHGFLHAGALATVMDTAAGFAALSVMPADAGVLTVEFKTSLMRPARGLRFRCEGRVVKPGRTLVFTQARALAIDADGAETELATMTATMMAITDRPGITG